MIEIPVRPRTVTGCCIGDQIAQKRIKAFTVSHREEIRRRTRQEERSWMENERYRKWKIKKEREKSFGLRKATNGNSDRDRGVLERVILSRNEYYAMIEGGYQNNEEEEDRSEEVLRPNTMDVSRRINQNTTFKL